MAEEAPDDGQRALDASVPNGSRMYRYLLDGKGSFAADREAADKLQAQALSHGASIREMVQVNRAFVLRGVTWCASALSIGQFLDVGCGDVLKPAVHDAARDGYEGARVVYVDIDPVVMLHVTHLQRGPGLGAVLADAADPASVLGDEAVRDLLDFTRPACVVLGGTLSAMDAATARAAVAGYAKALVPGSAMIISCASYADPEFGAEMAALFAAASNGAGQWRNHDKETVASFFAAGGLRLVRADVGPVLRDQERPGEVLGGVGIKP